MMSETERVMAEVDRERLTDRLTGRDGGLRTSKPRADGDDGLTVYAWRMARFHSGADPSMPVTCAWDLQEWLDGLGVDASVSGVTDDAGEDITAALDAVVEDILTDLGLDADGGARRWQKAGAL